MKPKIKVLTLAMIWSSMLSGCTMATKPIKTSSGVLFLSTYAAPLAGGPSKSESEAIQKASEYCSKLSKEIIVEKITTTAIQRVVNGNLMNAGNTKIYFYCK